MASGAARVMQDQQKLNNEQELAMNEVVQSGLHLVNAVREQT